MTIAYACDLSVRLEFIDDPSSDLIEIPRYTVAEKISLQLEFLSKLPGTYWHNELIAAVEQQQDDHKFILDTVLIENDNYCAMAPYWNDYKLKVSFTYMSRLFNIIGLDWQL